MFLSTWSVRRPIAMTAFIIILIMLGMNAYRKLSIDLMPSLDIPYIFIRCNYDGASPEEIEVEVARRIEDAISSIDGIKSINSTCLEDKANISVEFNMDVNVDVAATDVRERLNQIRDNFPEGVEDPTIRKIDNNATTVVQLFLVGDKPIDELYDFADNTLSNRFSSVSGVGEVRVYGADEMQVHVLIDRNKLATANLTMEDIRSALEKNNLKAPIGRVKIDESEKNVIFDGEYKNFDEILNTEIYSRDGKRIYLRDVGKVEMISKEIRNRVYMDGQPAASFNIIKKGEANALKVIRDLRKRFQEINNSGELPGGMRLVWFRDAGEFIEASVNDAWNSILFGVILTAVILFLFLHDVRTTFIVIVSMPISIAVTFGIMQYLQYSFNIMTLLSLGCSVGVLVTNSIVVIENIYLRLSKGAPLKEAAEKGTGEVIVAVAASALTNVVVFVPVALMTSMIGKMMASFAGVMVASTLVSLFISFTLTPILACVLLKKGKEKSKVDLFMEKLFIPWDKGYDFLSEKFNASIVWTKKHCILVVLLTVALCTFLGIFVIPKVGLSFIPDADQGEMTIRLEYPTNYNLEMTTKRTMELAQQLDEFKEITGKVVYVGNSPGGGGLVSQAVYVAQIFCKMVPKDQRKASLSEILNRVRAKFATVDNCIITLSFPRVIGGSGAALRVRLSGDDLQVLESAGREVIEKIQRTGLVRDMDSTIRQGKSTINLVPRRTILQNINMPLSILRNSSQGALEGLEVGTYRRGSRSFDIRIKQESEWGLTQIEQLSVQPNDGIPIPLDALAELKEETKPVSIARYDKDRSILLFANPADGVALGDLVNVVMEQIHSSLPPGYRTRTFGNAERMAETRDEFVEVIILAILLTYLLICAIMESWTRPFLIMFTVPLGFFGMYLTLFAARMSMSMMGLLGGVMLIGIVVNNAILIMDECATLIDQGVTTHKAMLQAVENKFRPIVMTSIASVVGMLPMALGGGLGSELRASCGVGVAGGLVFASLMTLYVIPALYFAFVPDSAKPTRHRFKIFLRKFRRGNKKAPSA